MQAFRGWIPAEIPQDSSLQCRCCKILAARFVSRCKIPCFKQKFAYRKQNPRTFPANPRTKLNERVGACLLGNANHLAITPEERAVAFQSAHDFPSDECRSIAAPGQAAAAGVRHAVRVASRRAHAARRFLKIPVIGEVRFLARVLKIPAIWHLG